MSTFIHDALWEEVTAEDWRFYKRAAQTVVVFWLGYLSPDVTAWIGALA